MYIVEGIFHVGEALAAGAAIEFICYAPDRLRSAIGDQMIAQARDRGLPIHPVTNAVLDGVSQREHSAGVLAVVHQEWSELADLRPEGFPWLVAVVSPQDPGNLGAILRTMDAVGAQGLILLNGGVDPFHPTAVRASMGALFWQRVVAARFEDFAPWTAELGYNVYGTSAHSKLSHREVRFQFPCILLVGSEREGLTSEQAAMCRNLIGLPMVGRVTSLNQSVAAGVLLYAMMGQHN